VGIEGVVRGEKVRTTITEAIHRSGPRRSLDAAEFAALAWVDWFDNRRLLEPSGNIPPAEAGARVHADLEATARAARRSEQPRASPARFRRAGRRERAVGCGYCNRSRLRLILRNGTQEEDEPMIGPRRGAQVIGGLAALATSVGVALASESIADQYPQSPLYEKPVEVIPHVWSAIGATAPPTYENTGHNNNLSFIVTGDGVVVINGGAAYALAEALHEEIRAVTDQPVRLVINENGQGHAMLGNSYWAEQGVPILAQEDAAAEFEETGHASLEASKAVLREKAEGTEVAAPTETFADRRVIEMGDFRIEALNLGPAHSPGDIVVWLPEQSLVISGDMAFHERLLPVFPETGTKAWLESWENFEALDATYVIPGHGHPTNMDQVRRYTRDYLQDLRARIGEHIDAGGSLADAYYVDQSAYAHLDTFEELATKNAGRVYEQMEWE
jgi:glyoxylase-like metal-dependent hydrolase (beta-lactamase superfamily II)